MSPLGIGMMIGGSVYGGANNPAVVIEDYFWEVPTAGELAPLALELTGKAIPQSQNHLKTPHSYEPLEHHLNHQENS